MKDHSRKSGKCILHVVRMAGALLLCAALLLGSSRPAVLGAGTSESQQTGASVSDESGSSYRSLTSVSGRAFSSALTQDSDSVSAFSKDGLSAPIREEGDELLICCQNGEFRRLLTDYYPYYEEIDDAHGMIGQVKVSWIEISADDEHYCAQVLEELSGEHKGGIKDKNRSDEAENAEGDGPVDIFLVTDSRRGHFFRSWQDLAVPVSELGITEEELADQFAFTKEAVSGGGGEARALSWTACPNALIYNRILAREVLGTDDPEAVGKAVADAAAYAETKRMVEAAGYEMQSGDLGEELWSDAWRAELGTDSRTFSWVGPLWMIRYAMWTTEGTSLAEARELGVCVLPADRAVSVGSAAAADTRGGMGSDAAAGAIAGKDSGADSTAENAAESGVSAGLESPGFLGGSWIAVSRGTDNPSLAADILRQMTTNPEILRAIAEETGSFVNSRTVMEEAAEDASYALAELGGQNPYGVYLKAAFACDGKLAP